ncbi:MAG: histidine kinase N-terminal domain-containing protein [Austwickia sp.]|nr:histidine kinase N-terminal domain-containing protein [Austwickia sp.]MBK8435873.1 histidine kinase N-terminal domain-containing protein [Austwickia sp.]MBK9101559.1 histidine kinase N-terminal domain-containing protein [Austwickia sp.]
MPALDDAVRRLPHLRPADVEWLHLLVGDWQLLADLAFADLVLWVQGGEGESAAWVVVAHARPNTGPLVFYDDIIGSVAGPSRRALLDECARRRRIVKDVESQWREHIPVREEAVPVVRAGRVLAVLTMHNNLATMRTPSRLEKTYRSIADTLATMIANGEFPTVGVPSDYRRGTPRVGDGVLALDVEGVVTYATPNAISALHRLGHHGDVSGELLSRIVTDLLRDPSVVDESLALVVTGRAPWRSEVESHGASLSLRAIPLTEGGTRIGAVVLLRDVSELRRRERELMTKDATIREIHHRVKNNLQTVAALLRLQSRRVSDQVALAALQEAVRRVATIAMVHDTLSKAFDEVVEFDQIADQVGRAAVEVASSDVRVAWDHRGGFGMLSADDATSVAMIMTELVHNAVEHGLRESGGTVTVEAQRWEEDDEAVLLVRVSDDGAGLSRAIEPGGSGLGTQIVTALVQDLRGRIQWEARSPQGTQVEFLARLRHTTSLVAPPDPLSPGDF